MDLQQAAYQPGIGIYLLLRCFHLRVKLGWTTTSQRGPWTTSLTNKCSRDMRIWSCEPAGVLCSTGPAGKSSSSLPPHCWLFIPYSQLHAAKVLERLCNHKPNHLWGRTLVQRTEEKVFAELVDFCWSKQTPPIPVNIEEMDIKMS